MEISNIVMVLVAAYLMIGVCLLIISTKKCVLRTKQILEKEQLGVVLGCIFVVMVTIYMIIMTIILWPSLVFKKRG